MIFSKNKKPKDKGLYWIAWVTSSGDLKADILEIETLTTGKLYYDRYKDPEDAEFLWGDKVEFPTIETA